MLLWSDGLKELQYCMSLWKLHGRRSLLVVLSLELEGAHRSLHCRSWERCLL